MKASSKLLPHTADIKFQCRARDLEGAYAQVTKALSSYISPKPRIKSNAVLSFTITADDEKALLYQFIEELIYHIDADGFAPARAKVKIKGNTLDATVWGDKAANYSLNQIKAPTYAEMLIKKGKNECMIECVLDV